MNKGHVDLRNSASATNHRNIPVSKIVNQRFSNGKREYKVIWQGETLQQATWEPEESINCPDKINQFMKRYQEVIKKKNLTNKAAEIANQSAQKVTQPSKQTIQKIGLEKPDDSAQQRISMSQVNQAKDLNRLKLQESIQKVNGEIGKESQRKSQVEEQKRQTISIKTLPASKKIQTILPESERSVSAKTETLLQPNLTQNGGQKKGEKKLVKQVPNLQMNGALSLQSQQKQKKLYQNQVSKPSSNSIYQAINDQSQQTLPQPFTSRQKKLSLIPRAQHLEIEQIIGFFFEEGNFSKIGNEEYQIKMLIVKNKFSNEYQIVPKERIAKEQPLKLIQFYEHLVNEIFQDKDL